MTESGREAPIDRLGAALMVAIRVHAGQVDKQGEPYLLHVLRVVEAVSDEAKVVAALHDVCEDSDLTPDTLASETPITYRERIYLSHLTRKPWQTYKDYINIIAGCLPGSLAREVKLADLRDNLGRIPANSDVLFGEQNLRSTDLRRRYEAAIRILETKTGEAMNGTSSSTGSKRLSVGVDLLDGKGEAIQALAQVEVVDEDVVRLTVSSLGNDEVIFDLSAAAAKEIGKQLSDSGGEAWVGP